MKVFIMWSGERSEQVATALHALLRVTLQGPTYFVSGQDLKRGEEWRKGLRATLDESDCGIACLTQENLGSPWMHFEAGAIARIEDEALKRMIPYLIGVKRSDVADPLGMYQGCEATKDGTFALVSSINEMRGESRLRETDLRISFDAHWPRLEDVLKSLPMVGVKKPTPTRAEELASETLEAVRELRRELRSLQAVVSGTTRPRVSDSAVSELAGSSPIRAERLEAARNELYGYASDLQLRSLSMERGQLRDEATHLAEATSRLAGQAERHGVAFVTLYLTARKSYRDLIEAIARKPSGEGEPSAGGAAAKP